MAKLPAPTVAHDDAYEIGCCVMDIVRCSASICTAQHFARKIRPDRYMRQHTLSAQEKGDRKNRIEPLTNTRVVR